MKRVPGKTKKKKKNRRKGRAATVNDLSEGRRHQGAGYGVRCGLKGCWKLDPKVWGQGKGFVPYPEKSFGVLKRRALSSYLCFEEISGCRERGNVCWGQGGLQGPKRGCWSGPDWDVVRATCPTPDFTLSQWPGKFHCQYKWGNWSTGKLFYQGHIISQREHQRMKNVFSLSFTTLPNT